MSYFFTAAHDPKIILFQMANRRATIFVSLTQAAAQIHAINETAIALEEDEFRVYADPFCLLVERVFHQPTNLLYVWASYGAGIYEALKGEHYDWLWGGGVIGAESQNHALPIQAQFYGNAPKAQYTKKIIGPHWYHPK